MEQKVLIVGTVRVADWPQDECQLREDTPSSDPGEVARETG